MQKIPLDPIKNLGSLCRQLYACAALLLSVLFPAISVYYRTHLPSVLEKKKGEGVLYYCPGGCHPRTRNLLLTGPPGENKYKKNKKRMQLPHLRTCKLHRMKFLFLGLDTLGMKPCHSNEYFTPPLEYF